MLNAVRYVAGRRCRYRRLNRRQRHADVWGRLEIHMRNSRRPKRHAITFFFRIAFLRLRLFAVAHAAAVFLGAGKHEKLWAGHATAAKQRYEH